MNIHDKIDLVVQWRETPETSFASEENLGILRNVIDYARASPNQYGAVSSSNFQRCVQQILAEIESYNAPLTMLLAAYDRQKSKRARTWSSVSLNLLNKTPGLVMNEISSVGTGKD